jgi:hypothetical protein
MSGPLIPVELVNIVQRRSRSDSLNENVAIVRGKNSQSFEVYTDPLGDTDPSCHRLQLCFSTQNKQSELFCLMLFTWEMHNPSRRGKARAIVWFLVLEKSSTTGDAYRRVGIGCRETYPNSSSEDDDSINEDWRITTIKLI